MRHTLITLTAALALLAGGASASAHPTVRAAPTAPTVSVTSIDQIARGCGSIFFRTSPAPSAASWSFDLTAHAPDGRAIGRTWTQSDVSPHGSFWICPSSGPGTYRITWRFVGTNADGDPVPTRSGSTPVSIDRVVPTLSLKIPYRSHRVGDSFPVEFRAQWLPTEPGQDGIDGGTAVLQIRHRGEPYRRLATRRTSDTGYRHFKVRADTPGEVARLRVCLRATRWTVRVCTVSRKVRTSYRHR